MSKKNKEHVIFTTDISDIDRGGAVGDHGAVCAVF